MSDRHEPLSFRLREEAERKLKEVESQLTASQARVGALEAMLELPDDLCIACGGTGGHFEGCTGTTGLIAMQARVKELEKAQIIHGAYECQKCGFTLQKNVLYVKSGNIGPEISNAVERCPNDNEPMVHLTRERLCKNLEFVCETQIKRVVEAEQRIATLEQALSVRDLALAAWSATFCKYVSWKANGVSNATLTEVIKDYERCSAISTALNEKEGK